jgi:hypothetical protein
MGNRACTATLANIHEGTELPRHKEQPEDNALPENSVLSYDESQYDSNNKSAADCPSCNVAKQLQKNDIWFHITSCNALEALLQGIALQDFVLPCNQDVVEAPVEKYYPFSASGIGIDKLADTVATQDNFFTPNNRNDSLWNDNKPKGPVVWWSRGEWAFDPYHNQKCCEHSEILVNGVNGIAIQDPQHILRVRTFADFMLFVDRWMCMGYNMYCIPGMGIDWDGIRAAGFAGVSIEFCKLNEAPGYDPSKCTYSKTEWHSSYDVSSLIVWDCEKAFGNRVHPIRLCV